MPTLPWLRHRWVVVSLAVVVTAGLGAGVYLLLRPPPRNLLLISMDTLRADHLGCYDYPKPTSPHIDALAARGTRFAEAFSTSAWTAPAHASLFTARYPTQLGIVRYKQLSAVDKVRPEERTLAEVLADEGYDTRAFTGGGFVSSDLGFGQGFAHYANAPAHEQDLKYHLEATLKWLKTRRDQERPFFLFLHFYDCHRPYDPPARWAKRFVPDPKGSLEERPLCKGKPPTADEIAQQVGLYDGQIAYADHQLKRVFDTLERIGHRDDTLVVFLSDHGEEFLDHGRCDHIHGVHDELVHVPLIMAGPGIPRGEVVHAPVSLVDVAPTVLDLLGVDPDHRMEGESLVTAMRGAKPARRYAFFETGFKRGSSVRRGARDGRAKLICNVNDQPLELYDLASDPGEHHNVLHTDALPHERARIERAYAKWRDGMHRPADESTQGGDEPEKQKIDPELEKRLRALGYAE